MGRSADRRVESQPPLPIGATAVSAVVQVGRRSRHPQKIRLVKTYAQVQLQIEKPKARADALRKKEAPGVVARICEVIAHYGLTSDDLFGEVSQRQEKAPAKTAAVRRKSKAKGHGNCFRSGLGVDGLPRLESRMGRAFHTD